jgi:hypothetical protein
LKNIGKGDSFMQLEKQWLAKPLYCTRYLIGMFCKEHVKPDDANSLSLPTASTA